jgi:hypothetical protein
MDDRLVNSICSPRVPARWFLLRTGQAGSIKKPRTSARSEAGRVCARGRNRTWSGSKET